MDVVNALYVAGGALGIAVTLATLAWRGFIGPAMRELVNQGHQPLADKVQELTTTVAAIAPATDGSDSSDGLADKIDALAANVAAIALAADDTDGSDGLADKIDKLAADIAAIRRDTQDIQSPQSGIRLSLQAIKTDTETILHG